MEPTALTRDEIRRLVLTELPALLRDDRLLRHDVELILSERFVEKEPFEERFDRVLGELRRDREEQSRRWEENRRELQAMREEQARKWEENQKVIRALIARDDELEGMLTRTIGALGARWGLSSERSFREALQAILEKSFGVKVERYLARDTAGEVFGRPDQVEIDVIVRNGEALAIELKSSVSKADVWLFDRKVAFFERTTGRGVTRRLVVSPMIDARAEVLAKELGMETYCYVGDVPVDVE